MFAAASFNSSARVAAAGSAVLPAVASSPPASRFEAVALNPQPLPPKAPTLFEQFAAAPAARRFDAVALNPQPLPPRERAATISDNDWCGTVPRRIPVPPPPLPGPWGALAAQALNRG